MSGGASEGLQARLCACGRFLHSQEVLLLEADFLLMAACLKPPSAGWHAENSGRMEGAGAGGGGGGAVEALQGVGRSPSAFLSLTASYFTSPSLPSADSLLGFHL